MLKFDSIHESIVWHLFFFWFLAQRHTLPASTARLSLSLSLGRSLISLLARCWLVSPRYYGWRIVPGTAQPSSRISSKASKKLYTGYTAEIFVSLITNVAWYTYKPEFVPPRILSAAVSGGGWVGGQQRSERTMSGEKGSEKSGRNMTISCHVLCGCFWGDHGSGAERAGD